MNFYELLRVTDGSIMPPLVLIARRCVTNIVHHCIIIVHHRSIIVDHRSVIVRLVWMFLWDPTQHRDSIHRSTRSHGTQTDNNAAWLEQNLYTHNMYKYTFGLPKTHTPPWLHLLYKQRNNYMRFSNARAHVDGTSKKRMQKLHSTNH